METKVCTKCGNLKILELFTRKGKGYNAQCKACTQETGRQHYQQNKQYYKKKAAKRRQADYIQKRKLVDSLKAVPCLKCGKSFPPCAMDFHHREKEKKKCELGKAVSSLWSARKILEEAQKCDILCACCHRIIHFAPVG